MIDGKSILFVSAHYHLLFYIGLQGRQCLFHDRTAEFFFLGRFEIHIANRIDYLLAQHDPVGADHFSYGDHG